MSDQPSAGPTPGAPFPRCRDLAGKTDYYVTVKDPGDPVDPTRLSDGGTWFCVRTCNQLGPDSDAVSPEECVPGRGCFRPDFTL